MFVNTLQYLVCPDCESTDLKLHSEQTLKGDVKSGRVICSTCTESFPIHDGVLIWLTNPDQYLRAHVTEREDHIEHIDESLESDRVTALYWLGHYVSAKELLSANPKLSATLKTLVKKYWDQGPMQTLAKLFKQKKLSGSMLELGCGSGGLAHLLGSNLDSYLGIDSAYQGVKRARDILITKKNIYNAPSDLVQGPLANKITAKSKTKPPLDCDFIVVDIEIGGLKKNHWDMVAAFNVIDMLEEPSQLFKLKQFLLKSSGIAVSSSPYIWHPETAKQLKPKKNESSQDRMVRMSREAGFGKIAFEIRDIPWLFFKNINQLEIYNVHLLGVRN
ncbi:MAG: methyltransferase domain-containing protein [Xanthomonadaceae bacterium]|nr:methyltransferase domain-containing protein [Xanthomonadaceae bacterium]